ncbi:MAG: hypothetical protein ABR511_12275 [Acidimicrobiales bacterium]
MPPLAAVDLGAVRGAIATEAARLTALLRSVRTPSAPALGDWDLTDVAVHVSHSLDVVLSTVRGGGPLVDDVWGLTAMSSMLVKGETTRDLAAIADRIGATVAQLLAVLPATGGGELRAWLVQGVDLPVSALACQALEELVVHGRDVARAEGAAWPVGRAEAALLLEGFLFPSLGVLGRSMVDQQAAAGVRAAYDVRLRGGGGAVLRFDDGDLAVTGRGAGPVDCHLSADPVAFLLVSWGRTSQWPAIARGRLLAWGRRPWLGLRLRSLLRNP